jgi:hypothetical protein
MIALPLVPAIGSRCKGQTTPPTKETSQPIAALLYMEEDARRFVS